MKPSFVSQAGSIAVRSDGGEPRVLLVRAKRDPSHWIFPKGHIEPGETAEAAALRELREEAGWDGTVVAPVGVLRFRSGEESVEVQYFLVAVVAPAAAGAGEPGRTPRWCTQEEALQLIPFEDARDLLARAMKHGHAAGR